MALVSYDKGDGGPNHQVYTWEGATNGGTPDTFQPVKLNRTPYTLTIAAADADSWAAATGPNVAIHGSLDNVAYYALQDINGVTIDITADGLVSVGEAPLWIKPVLTNGDSGTDIDVSLLVRFDSK